jgi:hypothetical protein
MVFEARKVVLYSLRIASLKVWLKKGVHKMGVGEEGS